MEGHTAVLDQGDDVREVVSRVDSVQPEEDGQGGGETVRHPVDGSAGNAADQQEQPEQPGEHQSEKAGEPPADPVAVLAAAVGELTEQVRAYHARAQARERVIDQLHNQIERLRVGEQGLLLRPIVMDLQHLRADLLHQARTVSPQLGGQQVVSLFESFALSVELTLERCGVVPIRPSVGTRFSPREHRAVKVAEAESPEADGTIDAVVAEGYRDTHTDRVTVPARVHVRRWTSEEFPQTTPVETAEPGMSGQSGKQESSADV
jgi:molecular chaperone GrpE